MFKRDNKELQAVYGSQKSYNKKAYMFTQEYYTSDDIFSGSKEGTWQEKGLTSYGEAVIWAHKEKTEKWETYHVAGKWAWQSSTTKRHILEYWMQVYGKYYSKGDDGYYSRRVDDDTAKKLIEAAFNMIYAANMGGIEVTWPDVYQMQDYAFNIDYAIGGKAWRATIENACQALEHGVPLEDVIA